MQMNDSLQHILAMAEAQNFSEDLTSAMVTDYHKGREAHEGKDGDWHGDEFDFPKNIMEEIAGALNYTIEGLRQGKILGDKANTVMTFLRWAADELAATNRREL